MEITPQREYCAPKVSNSSKGAMLCQGVFFFFFSLCRTFLPASWLCHCNLRENLHNLLKAQDVTITAKLLGRFCISGLFMSVALSVYFVRSSVDRMLCQIDISMRMHPCVACTVSITSKHRTPNTWRSVTPWSRHFAIFGNWIGCHLDSWSLTTGKALFALCGCYLHLAFEWLLATGGSAPRLYKALPA